MNEWEQCIDEWAARLRESQQAVERLERQLAEAKAGRQFGACPQCLTCAWEICKSDTPDAVEMKCSNGSTWWRCGYCLGKQQVAQLRKRTERQAQENYDLANELERLQTAHTTLRGLVEALDVPRQHAISVDDYGGQIRMPDGYVLYSTTSRARAYALENLIEFVQTGTLPHEGGTQEGSGEFVDSIKDRELDHGRDDFKR